MTPSSRLTYNSLPGGIVQLTLNRPRAANSIDDIVAEALVSTLQMLAADEAVKAVVLCGAGERVFCAGVDLKNPHAMAPNVLAESRRERVVRCLGALLGFEKPIVAALNGVASGAGLMLALLCDVVVARNDSFLQLPEIDVGMPTFLGFEIIKAVSGQRLACDLVLSGRRMPFSDAAAVGLIQEAVPFTALSVESERFARLLAEKPSLPYALNKRWINRQRARAIDDAAAESLRVQPLLHSGDTAGVNTGERGDTQTRQKS